MMKCKIEIYRDTTEAKKVLNRVHYGIYNQTSKTLFSVLKSHIAKEKMKSYKPKYEEDYISFEEKGSQKVCQDGYNRINNFLLGSADDFKERPDVSRVLNNRMVRIILKQIGKLIKGDATVLSMCNSFGITFKWYIENA